MCARELGADLAVPAMVREREVNCLHTGNLRVRLVNETDSREAIYYNCYENRCSLIVATLKKC